MNERTIKHAIRYLTLKDIAQLGVSSQLKAKMLRIKIQTS